MRLSGNQINKIEQYLNSKKLAQLDLRNEVVDHMATDIESFENEDCQFEEKFGLIKEKWDSELTDYSSYWLGIAWSGPKMMIEKCVKETKRMYLKTLLFSTLLAGCAYLFLFFTNNVQIQKAIYDMVGIVYFGVFCIIFVIWFSMKRSGHKTSYQFLFKIHAIGWSCAYIICNPFLERNTLVEKEGAFLFLTLFLHSILLFLIPVFWRFYTLHLKAKSYRLI